MRSLKANKMIYMLFILSIVFIVINVLEYNEIRKRAIEKLGLNQRVKAFEVAKDIEQDMAKLSTAGQTITSVAKNYNLNSVHKNRIEKQIEKNYYQLMEDNSAVQAVYVFSNPNAKDLKKDPFIWFFRDKTNKLIKMEREVLDTYRYWEYDWYKSALKSEAFTWTEPYLDESAGKYLISGIQALKNGKGEIVGIAGMDIFLDKIHEIIKAQAANSEYTPYLITAKGSYIYNPQESYNLKSNINKKEDKLSFLADEIKKNPKQGFVESNIQGKNKYYFYCKLSSNDWYVIIEQDLSVANKDMKLFMLKNLFIMILGNALIIALVITSIRYKKAEKKIQNLAFYNGNTELPNINSLNIKMPELLKKIDSAATTGAVMFLDLDNFKAVNDTLGHSYGDEFLKSVAKRFKACVHEGDEIFHVSGDEFIFVISSIKSKTEASLKAQQLLKVFDQPFYLKEKVIGYVTASIGIAMIEKNGQDIKLLLNNADDAMYSVKRGGKSNYKFYQKDMDSKVFQHVILQEEIKAGIANEEFKVFYQPKVNGKTGELLGMEALVRWQKSENKIIPPNEFVPFAEKTGLIGKIDSYVIKKACKQNKLWQEQGLKKIPVSVNLSAYELRDEDLYLNIKNILEDTGLESEYLEVEITESMVMENYERSIDTLKSLRALGVNIALDDFGTGYSSLNYLRTLPIDKVKIDKSFLEFIVYDEKRRTIVSSIILLLHSMNMAVVAEGVENQEQLEILNNYNCEEIQGYYFSKPVDHIEFEEIIKRGYLC